MSFSRIPLPSSRQRQATPQTLPKQQPPTVDSDGFQAVRSSQRIQARISRTQEGHLTAVDPAKATRPPSKRAPSTHLPTLTPPVKPAPNPTAPEPILASTPAPVPSPVKAAPTIVHVPFLEPAPASSPIKSVRKPSLPVSQKTTNLLPNKDRPFIRPKEFPTDVNEFTIVANDPQASRFHKAIMDLQGRDPSSTFMVSFSSDQSSVIKLATALKSADPETSVRNLIYNNAVKLAFCTEANTQHRSETYGDGWCWLRCLLQVEERYQLHADGKAPIVPPDLDLQDSAVRAALCQKLQKYAPVCQASSRLTLLKYIGKLMTDGHMGLPSSEWQGMDFHDGYLPTHFNRALFIGNRDKY